MFLSSNAFRSIDPSQLRCWDWNLTTVFLISHDWNPEADSAEALAGRRLARALLRAGARVHVLAASRPIHDFHGDGYDVTVVGDRPFPVNKIRRAVAMIRSTIPEMEGPWVPDAIHAGARVLASLPADAIIYGRAMPGVSNIVALQLARITGRPFVAHFSDEWPPRYALSNGRGWLAPYKWPLFKFWRSAILGQAGALTFTNPAQAEDVLGPRGKRFLDKSFVVTHLPEFQSSPVAPQYEHFHVVHTGNLYPGGTAAALMQGLRLFRDRTPSVEGRLRVTLAGWAYGDLPAWTERAGLNDVVRFAGRLNQVDVAKLMADASLLVAVDYARDASTTLLSKLPDYLNAGRPILAITAPSSCMGRLFHDDGAGLTAGYDSPAQVADRLSATFDAWRQQKLAVLAPRRTAIESFSVDSVLAELSAAFVAARRRQQTFRADHRPTELRAPRLTR